jgi:hypothetical protein
MDFLVEEIGLSKYLTRRVKTVLARSISWSLSRNETDSITWNLNTLKKIHTFFVIYRTLNTGTRYMHWWRWPGLWYNPSSIAFSPCIINRSPYFALKCVMLYRVYIFNLKFAIQMVRCFLQRWLVFLCLPIIMHLVEFVTRIDVVEDGTVFHCFDIGVFAVVCIAWFTRYNAVSTWNLIRLDNIIKILLCLSIFLLFSTFSCNFAC